ncbi:MAG: hypothetical protein H7A32_03855 [Deltaproteobacteria bacterium]|nr:hypothetical protein [Deltaproteobacteria bacterium]
MEKIISHRRLKLKFHFFIMSAIFLASALNTIPTYSKVLQENYSDQEAGFRISSPNEKWKFIPLASNSSPVRAMLRYESPINQFYPNINVLVINLYNDEKKLEEWLEDELTKLPEHIQLIEKKKIAFQEIPGYELKLVDKKASLIFLQRTFIIGKKRYILNAVAKTEAFLRFSNEFTQAFDSFVLIKLID